MKFALVGNQNCGKTTLFNQLTGSNQHVGNFPGVTVDSKLGVVKKHDDCVIVDLPGIYSLRPYTTEEIVTRDFILNEKPDGIINIVDATTIERNLYLTTQLMTMDIPMVIALNMMDEVRGNGGTVDIQKMSDMMGCPVVPISAAKNEGVDELIDVVIKTAKEQIKPKVKDICESDSPVHRCLHSAIHLIEDHAKSAGISGRFAAMNLITTGGDFDKRLNLDENEKELLEHSVVEMENDTGLDRDAAMASMTYDFIEKVSRECVVKPHESKERLKSEKIDKVLTNKYGAIPLFILIMAAIYLLTFQVIGKYIGLGIEMGIDALDKVVVKGLTKFGTNPAIIDFLDKGLFGGLGAVVSLLPYIVVMFMFLSLLEDSGYMARVAFIMDKPLRKLGLSGRSFVPIIVGFGCSVPAIMSTRTLASERDRKMTIGLIPFISCSAKAVVYYAVVNCGVFKWWQQSLIIVGLYVFGIVLGILTAFVSGRLIFKGKPVPFVMELPNYRLPSAKSVLLLMWEKSKDFLTRAFTVIFLATLVVWFLQAYNSRIIFITDGVEDNVSLLEHIGNFLAPVFKPLGMNDGKIVSALIAGFTAKEAVVSTIEMLAGSGGMTALFASVPAFLSFLTFVLLYTPCVATVATMRKELGSVWKTAVVVVYQCALAWVCSCIVYQIAAAC
ncbi:MAG: ferrous iron transport protein B [Clostridium sp.]|nr:ferrous iron transport protein B [Clostridium sp.]